MIALAWISLFAVLLLSGVVYLYCAIQSEKQIKANYPEVWASFFEGAGALSYPLTVSNHFVAFVIGNHDAIQKEDRKLRSLLTICKITFLISVPVMILCVITTLAIMAT